MYGKGFAFNSLTVFKITLDKDDFITFKHLEQIYILNGINSLLFFGHNLMLKEIQHAVCLRKTNHILLTGTFIKKNAQHNFSLVVSMLLSTTSYHIDLLIATSKEKLHDV